MAQTVKRLSTIRETWVRSLGQEDPLEKEWQSTPVLLPEKSHGQRSLVGYSPWGHRESDMTERLHFTSPTLIFLGFPCGSAGKESACNLGDLGSIPGLGRSPGERNSYLLQYSGLENFMDCIVHGVANSPTPLSDFHFQNKNDRHFCLLNIKRVQGSHSLAKASVKTSSKTSSHVL